MSFEAYICQSISLAPLLYNLDFYSCRTPQIIFQSAVRLYMEIQGFLKLIQRREACTIEKIIAPVTGNLKKHCLSMRICMILPQSLAVLLVNFIGVWCGV